MKRLIIICVVSLLITLAASSVAKALATAYDWSYVEGPSFIVSPEHYPELYIDYPWSGSEAYAGDSIGNYDDDWYEDYVYTEAYADIGSAWAYAETGYIDYLGYGYIWAEAYSEPPPRVNAWAEGYAYQGWWFYTYEDVVLTFSMDYQISQSLYTEYPGEWAYAYDEVGISLYDDNFNEINSNWVVLENYVEDGGYGEWYDEGTLYLKGKKAFPADTWAWIEIWQWPSVVDAYTIPATSAIILSGIGVSIVGWLRRHKTL